MNVKFTATHKMKPYPNPLDTSEISAHRQTVVFCSVILIKTYLISFSVISFMYRHRPNQTLTPKVSWMQQILNLAHPLAKAKVTLYCLYHSRHE